MNAVASPINFFVSQKLQQFGSDCSVRAGELIRAQSLLQVQMLADVRTDPLVRWARHSEPAYRRLKVKAERRAGEILSGQLAKIAALTDGDRRNAVNQLRAREWCFLRGNWPMLAQKAEREAAMLLRDQ